MTKNAADIHATKFDTYRAHLEVRRVQAIRHATRLRRLIKTKRVFIFGVIGYAVFDPSVAAALLPALLLLLPAVYLQDRIHRGLCRARRGAEFYRHGIARIAGRWSSAGDSGQRYLGEDELILDDLDIFGHGSLFQFLSTARTSVGQDTLADWLIRPAKLPEIQRRQRAVDELRLEIEFREQLAVVALDPSRFRPEALAAWGDADTPFSGELARAAALGAGVAAVALAVAWLALEVGVWALGAAVMLELGFYACFRRGIRTMSVNGYRATTTLELLARLTATLKDTHFASPALAEIADSVFAAGKSPSRGTRIAYGILIQFPVLACFFCQLVPWSEQWRRRIAAAARHGLRGLGQLEALASLAQYADEQSDTIFPTVVEDAVCFEAVGLGHPLIPTTERVANDVSLNSARQLLLISGSNMSGKSTMLRTVGVNAVLARCGAPVCAKRLRTSVFAIGTAMRFRDSLDNRTSHFLAVILRLRRVLDLADAGPQPLLFLLDEILQGTNSRDRVVGAEAVLRKLVDHGAVGMVTTHDLQLTRIVDNLGDRAANVHFVDRLVDGDLCFDYKMRPGVVRTTNALTLMRKMGLDV